MSIKIKIGAIATEQRRFKKEDGKLFAELSGDTNPIHFNEEYAKKTLFKKTIVHGHLVLSMLTSIFANKLPGPGSIYLGHTVSFIRPVYYDDLITVKVEIVNINEKEHIFIDSVCLNQNEEIVIKSSARLKKM